MSASSDDSRRTSTPERESWQPVSATLDEAFQTWRGGDWLRASELFQQKTVERPADPDAWRGLGSAYWTLHRFHDALAAFRVALSLDSWSAKNWTTVGLALRDLQRWQAAANALHVAVLLDPGYAPAWNELANVHVDCGRPDIALPMYDRVLTLDRKPAVYHHNRGVALRLLGDTIAATRAFRDALDRDPRYSWSLRELGEPGPG